MCRARTITVKIRFGDFQSITRSMTLNESSDQTDRLWRETKNLFDKWVKSDIKPVRLIDMGVSQPSFQRDLSGQLDLFTKPENDRSKRLDVTTDAIRYKFGLDAIHLGSKE